MSKHPKPSDQPVKGPDDLERNPGIGQSKGAYATGEDPEDLEGINTTEGDTANRVEPSGRVRPDDWGRTNP